MSFRKIKDQGVDHMAEVFKREQKNIQRKREKETSRSVSRCMGTYNENLNEFKEADAIINQHLDKSPRKILNPPQQAESFSSSPGGIEQKLIEERAQIFRIEELQLKVKLLEKENERLQHELQTEKTDKNNAFKRVQKVMELPTETAEFSKNKVVLSDHLKQEIKVFRKSRAPFVIRDVEKLVRPRLKLADHPSREIQEYVTACIEIAWLSAVQDPPLELDATCTDRFNPNIFKDYTRRGEFVDFVVWPALFLHKGGPLVSKGVAQGRCYNQTQTRNQEEPGRHIPAENVNSTPTQAPTPTDRGGNIK